MCSVFLKNRLFLILLCIHGLTAPLRAQYSFKHYIGSIENDYPARNIAELDGRFYFSGYYPRVFAVFSADGNIINYNTNLPFELFKVEYLIILHNDTVITFGHGGDLAMRPSYSRFTKDGDIIDTITYNQMPRQGSIVIGIADIIKKMVNSVGTGGIGSTSLISFQKIDFYGKLLHFTLVGGTEGYDRLLGMFPKKGSSDFLVFTQTELFTIDSMGVLKDRRLHRPLKNGYKKTPIEDVIQEPDSSFTSFSHTDYTFPANLSCFRHDYSGHVVKIDSIPAVLEGADIPFKFCKTKDGGYLFANWYIFKTDSLLNLQWIQHLDDDITLKKIAQASDGGYYGCGEKYFEATKLDYLIFKTLPDGRILTGNEEVKNEAPFGIKIYPNPAGEQFTIQTDEEIREVQLYNMMGQVIYSGTSKEVATDKLPYGVYVLHVVTNKNTYVQRILKK
jgi:hypothetical protein